MAFFSCLQCKKVWHYPIEKCPECFLNVERVKSKRAKVVGVSKVSIPSLFHSKVPYFVLVLEDENKNRWVQKSREEYKIEEEIMFEGAKDREGVALWRVKYDFLEAIEKVVELLGGLRINKNSQILILPTLKKASHPYLRDNTSPEFLEAFLKFLFQLGARAENIKVCSQSFDEIDIAAKAQKSGILTICQKYKVIPFDLAKGGFVKKGDLEIAEEVFKVDFIFNLPILKIGKAQASENIFTFLKKENFLAQKYLYSEGEIFKKLKKEMPEIFTVAEANHIQDEKGFTYYLNLLLASFNCQNLDKVFFQLVGKKTNEILEKTKEDIQVFGRKKEEVAPFYEFKE